MAINVQNIERFKFIAHKIIPLVYDDSLSYYEFLCKVMQKLNEVISSLDNQNEILKEFDKEILDWETSTDNKYNQFVSNINTQFEAFKQGEVAARTAFMNALIGSYNESTHYNVGQYVRYGDNVYKCTTATSGETWNPAHWTQVVYADDLSKRQSDYEASITGQQNEFESSMQTKWNEFSDQYLKTLAVVQNTGTSTTEVMSQKAVTDNLAKKVEMVSSISPATRVYGVRYNSTETMMLEVQTSLANKDSIPRRGTNGTFAVGTPTNPTDAVNKEYVDKLFSQQFIGTVELVSGEQYDTAYHHQNNRVLSIVCKRGSVTVYGMESEVLAELNCTDEFNPPFAKAISISSVICLQKGTIFGYNLESPDSEIEGNVSFTTYSGFLEKTVPAFYVFAKTDSTFDVYGG